MLMPENTTQETNQETNTTTNEEITRELDELRQFKAQKEAEEQFTTLVKEIEPIYAKTNGKKGHVDRFVKEYQTDLSNAQDKEKWISDISKKDSLYFEKPPAVKTSNFFQNQTSNQQPQQTKTNDDIDNYFVSRTSTLRKRG